MTISQIIVCVLSVTAAIVSTGAYIATVRRARTRPARYDVRWHTPGGEFTARGLTQDEFDILMTQLKSEEQPDA